MLPPLLTTFPVMVPIVSSVPLFSTPPPSVPSLRATLVLFRQPEDCAVVLEACIVPHVAGQLARRKPARARRR
jgi:hypothetical protein